MRALFTLSLLLLTLSASAWQKIAADQSVVPARSGPWSCVAQNNLMWEVKGLTDDLLHYKNTFSWYSNQQGTPDGGSCQAQDRYVGCDVQDLVDQLNARSRCGLTTWRLPTVAELTNLLGEPTSPGGALINQYLFPRPVQGPYWTSDLAGRQPLVVNFKNGQVYPLASEQAAWVRLVADKP